MSLPKEILEIFYETLNGDRSIPDFEQWLYANRQLESMMTPEDYLDLISLGYKDRWAAHDLPILLGKHIQKSEFELYCQKRKRYPQGYTLTPIDTPFDEQLQRIKDKLITAKNADADCDVFASCEHEYLLNVPVTEEEVLAFERKHSIRLPECFRSFVMVVGNGGISSGNSGAGPGYGIFPLGYEYTEYKFLANKCLLDPDMTTDQWKALHRTYGHSAFSGVLPVGTEGCTYVYAIVLNGPFKGRVVNLDYNYIVPPIFTPNTTNFLDYYEGWLDGIINGRLKKPGSNYGYY